jgi:hypothetical protein
MNVLNESAISGAIATQGMCQTPSLYQNQTSLPQMNQQNIQQIQPICTSNANTNTNQVDFLLQNKIPSCSNQGGGLCGDGFSWYSNEDISKNEQQESKKPEWQTVNRKHKRISRQRPAEVAEQINTANRYKSLSLMHCDDDITGNDSETDTTNKKKDPKPSPFYMYGVTDYKAMVENLAKAVDEETYFTKTLSNNTVRISTISSETYRKLICHIQDQKNNAPYISNQTGQSLQNCNTRSTSFNFNERNQE